MKPLFTSLAILLFCSFLNAQSTAPKNQKNLKTKYSFSITNVTSFEQVKLLQSSFEGMKHIEKVKLNYKEEKPTLAQIIVFVNEPKRSSEDQIMFDPVKLKNMLIDKNLSLSDLKISDY